MKDSKTLLYRSSKTLLDLSGGGSATIADWFCYFLAGVVRSGFLCVARWRVPLSIAVLTRYEFRMKKITFAALAVCISVAGCASSGVRVKDEQLAEFVPGKTTKQDVIARLGVPTSSMRNSDGSSMIMYTYSEARTRATTFIPIVGLFAGGVDTNATNVMLQFDPEGKLLSHSSSETALGTATGVAAGSVDSVPDQPRKP